jgi:hypothetical protein
MTQKIEGNMMTTKIDMICKRLDYFLHHENMEWGDLSIELFNMMNDEKNVDVDWNNVKILAWVECIQDRYKQINDMYPKIKAITDKKKRQEQLNKYEDTETFVTLINGLFSDEATEAEAYKRKLENFKCCSYGNVDWFDDRIAEYVAGVRLYVQSVEFTCKQFETVLKENQQRQKEKEINNDGQD